MSVVKTSSMERNPSWEANSTLAGQNIPPHHIMQSKGSLPHSQILPIIHIMSQIKPIHATQPI